MLNLNIIVIISITIHAISSQWSRFYVRSGNLFFRSQSHEYVPNCRKSWMSLAWPYKPRIQQLYPEEKCASVLLKWSKFLHLQDLNVTNLDKNPAQSSWWCSQNRRSVAGLICLKMINTTWYHMHVYIFICISKLGYSGKFHHLVSRVNACVSWSILNITPMTIRPAKTGET